MFAFRPPASKTVLTTASSPFVEHQLAPLWWHLHPVQALCKDEHIKRMVCSIPAWPTECQVQISALVPRRPIVESPVVASTPLHVSSGLNLLAMPLLRLPSSQKSDEYGPSV